MSKNIQKCGYVSIIGRPNVGKSTLLNKLIGQKISITSRKPQTTRHSILGIATHQDTQIIYVDTPGIHDNYKKAINRYMNKSAINATLGVDIIIFMIEGLVWNELDELVLQKLQQQEIPVILVVNKVDKIKRKDILLPYINELALKYNFEQIIPLSAKTSDNIDKLENVLQNYLPEHDFIFDASQITDRPMRFIASEIVREKIFRLCGQELPYSATVEIEKFKLEENIYHIAALILVEKESHKRMIIGNKGEKLKEIGRSARIDLEQQLDNKVFLECWVKVKAGWADKNSSLINLGYD